MKSPAPVERVVELIAKMPGIGKKTAQRLTYFILAQPDDYAANLGQAIQDLKASLKTCPQCFNFCHSELCTICANPNRDQEMLCVVEDAISLSHVERTGHFKGLYHVLQGALSPVHGIGPGEIRVHELLARLKTHHFKEVIMATNPTLEGEATALYLAEILQASGIYVSRIGTGIPIGGSLDYVDDLTMAKALDNRRPL